MTGRKYFKLIHILSGGIQLLKLPLNLVILHKVVVKQTYYDEYKRKNYLSRYLNNLKWLIIHNEINYSYNSYGLDVKGFRKSSDFIPYRKVKYLRDYNNQYNVKNDYNYVSILRDKMLFSVFFSQYENINVVKNIAYYDDGNLVSSTHQHLDWNVFLDENTNIVLKKVDGECGSNIYFLNLSNNVLTINNNVISIAEISDILGNSRYVIQKYIVQHKDISRLNPYSVNSIRLITIIKDEKVHYFSAFLRLGVDKISKVDNRTVGGIGVGINYDGTLQKYGFTNSKFGQKYDAHPLTQVEFEGLKIPYWNSVIDMVFNAHEKISDVKSIGWDVAITENGPLLIEGNDNWEIIGPQDTHGGLKKRFIELMT